ncbi:hypothetical protein BRC2024_KCUCJSVR_CDS_0180 [Acinetobacter phage vB_AbaM_KissB]
MGTLLVISLIWLYQAISDYLYEDSTDEVWYLYFTSLILGGAVVLWLTSK